MVFLLKVACTKMKIYFWCSPFVLALAFHHIHAEIARLSRHDTVSGQNIHRRNNVRSVAMTNKDCVCECCHIIPRRVNVSGVDTIQDIVANKTYDELLVDYALWLFQDKPIEQIRLEQPLPGVVFVDPASGVSMTVNQTDVLLLNLFGYISWDSPTNGDAELELLRSTVASWLGIAPVHAHGLSGPELHRMTAILMTITDSDFELTLKINDCQLLATSDLSVSEPIEFGSGFLPAAGTIGVAAGFFAAIRLPVGVYDIQYSYRVSGNKYITGFVGLIEDDPTIIDVQVTVLE